MKKLNKSKNKKAETDVLGGEVLGLIIAVLCIVILIFLGVALYDFFLGSGKELKQAQLELGNIKSGLSSLEIGDNSKSYIITGAVDWYLFSDEYGDLCNANFCLCICHSKDCSKGIKTCTATDKFVIIRNEGKETREIPINSPLNIKLKLSDEKAYPFNGGKSVDDYWIIASSVTPLFFKFDKDWKWSPDLANWMSTNTLVVSGGVWNGQNPSKANSDFISFFSKINGMNGNEEKGQNLFNDMRVHKSEGFYIIEK